MAPATIKQIVLAERPTAHILPTTFRTEVVPYPAPGAAQVVVKVEYLSMEPAMRGWLKDARSYIPPVQIGEVMRAMGLGTVVEAGKDAKFKVGDTLIGGFGWAEYRLMDDSAPRLEKVEVPPKAELLDLLGVLGLSGLTAYFGLLDVGKVQAGETLVVSGAGGAVGSVACQLGKLRGARVVGLAGSDDKCRWLEAELGVDRALNYKSDAFRAEFREAVGYLDVFFDNVGGEILDFALTRLNKGARIALCGAISDYNKEKPAGLTNYLSLIGQRAKLEGFIVLDYAAQWPAAAAEMAGWLADGSLKRKFTVVPGLARATDALGMLFTGGNTGKTCVCFLFFFFFLLES
ncbi:alcohol dehydrogenase [Phellopilus nigrolimitatus]|nr:alcohol dehydrogenase [Phellopilus nigrolimitatus]